MKLRLMVHSFIEITHSRDLLVAFPSKDFKTDLPALELSTET
jgi:hypothetical protein